MLSAAKGNEFCRAAAKYRPKLTRICLNECEEATDEGLAALIMGCPLLLPSHAVSFAKGDLFCASVAKQHPALDAIDLRDCPAVTDTGLTLVVASCLRMTPSNILSYVKGDHFCEAVSKHRPDVVQIDFRGCSKLKLKDVTGSDEEATEEDDTGPPTFDPLKKHDQVSVSADKTVLNKNNTGWNDGSAVIAGTKIVIPKMGQPVAKKIQRWSCRFDKGGAKAAFGIVAEDFDCKADGYVGKTEKGWGYFGEGKFGHKTKTTSYGEKFADGDVVDVEVDAEACTVRFFKNGVDKGVATSDLPRDRTYYAGVSLYAKGDKATLLSITGSESLKETSGDPGLEARLHSDGFFNVTPIGAGDVPSDLLFNSSQNSRRVQSIYTASDIVIENGRAISAIQLRMLERIEHTLDNFRIEYGLTKESSLEESWLPTTPCYGPKTLTPDNVHNEGKWTTFELSEPIKWDGHSNLVLQYSFNGPDVSAKLSCKGNGAIAETKEDGRTRFFATSDSYAYHFDDSPGATDSGVPHLRLKFCPMVRLSKFLQM